MKYFLICFLFLVATPVSASEVDHELPAGLTYYNEKTGEFALKEHVLKNFGIQISDPVETEGVYEVPNEAIVRSLKKTEIFVKRSGRFKLIPVKIVSLSKDVAKVAGDLESSQIVVRGNNFLKTLLLSLEEGPAEGH